MLPIVTDDSTTIHRDYVLDFIAIFVVLGFFFMCVLMFFVRIDIDERDLFNVMFGQLSSGFIMVLAHYFRIFIK